MQREQYIFFLTEKLAQIVELAGPAFKLALAGPNAAALAYMTTKPRLTLVEIKRAEAEFELMAQGAIGRGGIDAVTAKLTKKFGFGRIADDPNRVVGRVIKRGRILNKDEYRIVLGAVSYVGDDGLVSADRQALEKIYKNYQSVSTHHSGIA